MGAGLSQFSAQIFPDRKARLATGPQCSSGSKIVRRQPVHISGPTAGIEFQDFSGRGKAFVIVAQIDVDDAQIMGRYRSYGIVHTPADSQIAVTLPNIFRQVRVSLAEFRCAGVLPLPVAIQENVPLFLPGS